MESSLKSKHTLVDKREALNSSGMVTSEAEDDMERGSSPLGS